MYHSIIHGLVIRDSSETANSQNPLGSGLRQCYDFWVRPRSYAATKPKARSPMGFCFVAPHMRNVGGVCRPDPYTSKAKGVTVG